MLFHQYQTLLLNGPLPPLCALALGGLGFQCSLPDNQGYNLICTWTNVFEIEDISPFSMKMLKLSIILVVQGRSEAAAVSLIFHVS